MKLLSIILSPISLIYAAITFLRNRAYDLGWFSSKSAAVPTVVVGNVTVGGTGKSPFSIYLLQLLSQKKTGFLSRGYGRSTKGIVQLDSRSNPSQVGDEPLLIFQRTSPTIAAVCEDRLKGIEQLMSLSNETQLIVLDDAMQHRRLHPTFLITLTTYQNLFYQDFLLPTGRLRDNRREVSRANAVVVTKCPKSISDLEQKSISDKIRQYTKAPIYFSYIAYSEPIHLFGSALKSNVGADLLVATGLANPEVFVTYLSQNYSVKKVKEFPDHHNFSIDDVRLLIQEFEGISSLNKAIFVTEKDAVKLREFDELRDVPVFFVPIDFKFVKDESQFEKQILNSLNL